MEQLQKNGLNGTIIRSGVLEREEDAMAGLLELLTKRLLGSMEPKKTVRVVTRTAPKEANTTEPTANEWVRNSTITEPAAVTEIDRTIKRERTYTELEREDLLLNQIDEFREKAQQLQELLLSKESKAVELQHIVDEREGKARELEHILSERQRRADGITEEMTKQIDSLIDRVSAKVDEIGTSIHEAVGKELSDSRQLSEKQVEELKELKELLATLTPQLEEVKTELSDKVHTENVKCYRNIADLFKSMEDKMDKVNDVQQSVSSVRKCTITIIVLTVINMLGLVALALYELGVFQMLLG